ncbi:MAG: MBL fold metallo-hydrolase [Treponema sp.]|nr:MBL fold metallo-hydrolase [Candidatus Treponema equifaecale]
MNIRFWGVRGSVPTPMTNDKLQEKITQIIQRITPEDIASPQSRLDFFKSLPDWLKSTAGGNTPCVELTSKKGSKFVFDAGTGIRVLGKEGEVPSDYHYNLFFSHFHWDHIQGLPFFDQIYNPRVTIDVYSPFADMEYYLRNQMIGPYYPVNFDSVIKNFRFHVVEPGVSFNVDGLDVTCIKMSHPGDSFSYSVEEDGKKFVYATDVELRSSDFVQTEGRRCVFENADLMIIDSQYTVEEAIKKENWGHSAFCYGIDFAANWKARNLYLFHHEPMYDDRKLNMILESARWYSEYICEDACEVKVHLAVEGLEVQV